MKTPAAPADPTDRGETLPSDCRFLSVASVFRRCLNSVLGPLFPAPLRIRNHLLYASLKSSLNCPGHPNSRQRSGLRRSRAFLDPSLIPNTMAISRLYGQIKD